MEKLAAKIAEAIEKQRAKITEYTPDVCNQIYGGLDPDRVAAYEACEDIRKFCKEEKIDFNEHDEIIGTVYPAFGIRVEKVPVRYYPGIIPKTGSLYIFRGIENAEELFYDEAPVGKTFEFRLKEKIGEEDTYISYFFKVEKELQTTAAEGSPEAGWKRYDGSGKPEGYRWSGGTISVKEENGEILSAAIQKMYMRPDEPIWKKVSPFPVDDYIWLGINADIPADLELPVNGYYYDETTDPEPPRGLHYKEQGILAYDDSEEIVILGVTDYLAEKVVIPREINGKPVTVLDKECFVNCSLTLREVVLPDTIREIGDQAFRNCSKLIRPKLPASVEKIGKDLFMNADAGPGR